MISRAKITICLDFDLTITGIHLHNACMDIINFLRENGTEEEIEKYKKDPMEYLWQKLQESNQLVTFGDPREWNEFINAYLTDEYNFSITTRSAFPKIVERFLREIILVDTSKIHIEAGNTSAPDKVNHIARSLNHFNGQIANTLAGAILLDDTDEKFALIEDLGGRTIKLPGDETNLMVAKARIGEEIEKAHFEILKAEKGIKRKEQIKDDEEKLDWLDEKLMLVTRLFDYLRTTESRRDFHDISYKACEKQAPFSELIIELEKVFMSELNVIRKTPWGENLSTVELVRVINDHDNSNKYHVLRISALVLQQAYQLHPAIKNEEIAKLIQDIKDIPGGYKEKTSKKETYLVEPESLIQKIDLDRNVK